MPLESGLLEYSVVYTDRALNLMSPPFQQVMKDISAGLKRAYNAKSVAVIPGSGTYGMEAAARQFALGKKCLVVRNGYFSFRWTQILEQGKIPSECTVIKAKLDDRYPKNHTFRPPDVHDVLSAIRTERPAVVFAPHVETSVGLMLPDTYVKAIADAVHEVGGIFVLDGIASGTVWVDMEASGVDVYLSAPQKGWTAPACAALVMMSDRARKVMDTTESDSFCCNLKKWTEVMEKYEAGAFMYHTTMPTDALAVFRDALLESEAYGLPKMKDQLFELGGRVASALESMGLPSVAAKEYQSPGVVVVHCKDASAVAKFKAGGIQVAGGVPFMIGEPEGIITFRIGLFGLDKLQNIDRTVERIVAATRDMLAASKM